MCLARRGFPAHARAAEYALGAGGFGVELCGTLAAALERLADAQRPRPIAVVLDLTLPDSEGVETFDRRSRSARRRSWC